MISEENDCFTGPKETSVSASVVKSMPCKLNNDYPKLEAVGGGLELTRLYRRRFWMLLLFSLCTMLNSIALVKFSIISGSIECYYKVTAFDVNGTTLVFLVAHIVMVFPVTWFINRYGLRVTTVTSSAFSCLGVILQCFSLNRNGFPIVMISQTLSALSDVLVWPVTPKLAAVWFGPNEVCRATSIGVMGDQIGFALGFLIPAVVVSNDCSNMKLLREGLGILAYVLTACNVLCFIFLLLTFQKKPPFPPSIASKAEVKADYKTSLIALRKNYNFYLLLLTFGLGNGVLLSFSALLNQMLAPIYKGAEKEIGLMGLCFVVAGFVGIYVVGYILDLTHKFKSVYLTLCAINGGMMAVFTGCLYLSSLWAQFAAVVILGIFGASPLTVGFEFASEITYPVPSSTTASFLNASIMICALIITTVGSYLLQNYGILSTCLFFCSALLLAFTSCVFIKPELRRTETNMRKCSSKTLDFQLIASQKTVPTDTEKASEAFLR